MAPSSKTGAASKDRRKSDKVEKTADESVQSPGLVTLTVSSEKLRAILDPTAAPPVIKEDSPSPAKESPATSNTLPAAPASNNENASDSTPGTPAADGTPAPPSVMGPPAEGPKKKGGKRSAAAMAGGNGDGTVKVRNKPGPKKKQKLDDSNLDSGRAGALGAAHKLGPKANQGAINAGLRALDRSGKPCRKWAKGGFQLKSFTGVAWEIPRWTAPPKPKPEPTAEESASASVEGSSKENKENEQVKSDNDNSNSGGDVEMQSVHSVNPSSPAPMPIAAAS